MTSKLALVVALSLLSTSSMADGLPIFSADGDHIGHIVQIGADDHGFVAEVEQPMGLGGKLVAVPKDAVETREDHAVLRMSIEDLAKIAVPLDNEYDPDP